MDIKLFVAVEVLGDGDAPHRHVFCFDYGPPTPDNLLRAVKDYVFNSKANKAFIELSVDAKPVFVEDIQQLEKEGLTIENAQKLLQEHAKAGVL